MKGNNNKLYVALWLYVSVCRMCVVEKEFFDRKKYQINLYGF